MKLLCLSLVLLMAAGCSSDSPAKVEHSGVGYVRSLNASWGTYIVFETGDGHVKGYQFCYHDDPAPLWKGEHGAFSFSWDSMGECYHLVSSDHLPPDVKP